MIAGSRGQVEQFLLDAQNNGLAIVRETNDAGVVSGYGNEVQYVYDQAKAQISLTLRHHVPFLAGAVWKQVEQRLPAGVLKL